MGHPELYAASHNLDAKPAQMIRDIVVPPSLPGAVIGLQLVFAAALTGFPQHRPRASSALVEPKIRFPGRRPTVRPSRSFRSQMRWNPVWSKYWSAVEFPAPVVTVHS